MNGSGELAALRVHIGAQQTTLAPADRGPALALGIGSRRTAEDRLAHDPPRPAQLERAITAIEDALEQARPLPPHGRVLLSGDALPPVLVQGGHGGEKPLTHALVEQHYQQLARLAMAGTSTGSRASTATAHETATLLILREMMHHLDIPVLYLAG